MNIAVEYIWTIDGLELQGIHYNPPSKDLCILIIHGMSGSFIENKFAHVLGQTLSTNNIGMIYGHNRGYNHINDIATKNGQSVRIGATYERFTESEHDIEAWINHVFKLGYQKLILLGHSLGCNKILHFLSKHNRPNLIGLALASPPDIVGLFNKPEYQPNHQDLLKEAQQNIKAGNPRKLVSGMVWDWYQLSSQTYVDLSQTNGPIDNLPVLRNPKVFPELAAIKVPILGIMGEYDDIAMRTLEEDMDLIASKATRTAFFTKEFIAGANHTYDQKEKQFSENILNWIQSI